MRYRMRKPDGMEYTLDVHPAALLARRIKGRGDPRIGQQFVRHSRLDGSRIVETLVGFIDRVPLKTLSTWNRGLRSDACGINPDQRLDALQADAEMGLTSHDYDPVSGEAIFKSRGAYRKYCEAHALYQRNGGYGDAQKLSDRERENKGLPPRPAREVPQLI